MNAPETTLVCVGAMKLKKTNKKKTGRVVLFLPLLLLLYSCICLGRTLITIICINASSFCSISFHARFSKGAQNELFVLSSSTTFPRYSLLLVGIKANNHYTFTGDGGGGFIRVVICMVLYYTLIFCQNIWRAGHVHVLLACHLPFLI